MTFPFAANSFLARRAVLSVEESTATMTSDVTPSGRIEQAPKTERRHRGNSSSSFWAGIRTQICQRRIIAAPGDRVGTTESAAPPQWRAVDLRERFRGLCRH